MLYLKKILDFLFPIRCVGCKIENFWICPKCLGKIHIARSHQENWIISVFDYRNVDLRKLLWHFKFKRKWSVIDNMADTLYDHLIDEISERNLFENITKPLLIPIPMTKRSIRKRGYNQAAIVAKKLYEKSQNFLEINMTSLKKFLETEDQNKIKNREARFENIKNAFMVNSNGHVRGRNIILVDDIVTTGATLMEAKKVLLQAGAESVLAFTVAH